MEEDQQKFLLDKKKKEDGTKIAEKNHFIKR